LDQYYPCRTWDPSQAASFYVPAYMGISLIYNWEAICETSCDIQTITAVDEGAKAACEITCSEPSYLRGYADGLLEEMNRLPYLQRSVWTRAPSFGFGKNDLDSRGTGRRSRRRCYVAQLCCTAIAKARVSQEAKHPSGLRSWHFRGAVLH
jgi:hypothetical protein